MGSLTNLLSRNSKPAGQRLLEEHPTGGRALVARRLAVGGHGDEVVGTKLDLGVQRDLARFVRTLELMHMAEPATFALLSLHHLGEIERADDHVLGGRDERATVCR
jgi:hypothetical protein